MAIYHLEAKVISRGAGRSAVAAAAYMSCSAILNDYDGIQHDYTRKHGLVWQQVFLPEYAPAKWQDRAILWNAVEENEKTKDSRLAREFVVALPIELDREQQQTLLTEYIGAQFTADGMCADVCIHDTDGHNPHAHIMLTVRPLDEQGKWQYKTEKEYLCVKNGEERGFTAAEFKAAQADGWEKQYQYKVDRKKVYLPPTEAEAKGYERLNKYPKSTKYGRQNPISQRWNSEKQLIAWRRAWAETANRYLERVHSAERIDHRSHAERGLDEQPTVHEGVIAQALERKGIVSDRCELNRQIKADNKLLRELKAGLKKLLQSVKQTIPAIAEAMESLRANMQIFRYQVLHLRYGKSRLNRSLDTLKPELDRYMGIARQIKETAKERKELLAEKKATPLLSVLKHRDLSRRIAELTEKLEELRSEKAMLLSSLEYAEDTGTETIRKDISTMEAGLQKLDQQEQKYAAELDSALAEYAALKEQAAELDPVELYEARQAIRPAKERSANRRLQEAYGERFNVFRMHDSENDVSDMLGEEREERSVRKSLRQKQQQQVKAQRQRKPKHYEQER